MKKRNKSSNGYASTYALIAIGILSILAAAATGPEYIIGRHIVSLEKDLETENDFYGVISDVLTALVDDPTPESDSDSDPVWDLVDDGIGEYNLALQDISTGLNLNTIPLALLQETSLAMASSGGSLATTVSEWRENGPNRDESELIQSVPEEVSHAFFSLYGLLNPRTCDSEILTTALSSRLGSETASFVASTVISMGRQPDTQGAELETYLSSVAPDVLPIVSFQPMINVNFAERDLLESVLAFSNQGQKLDDPGKLLGGLMFDRLAGEVLPQDLYSRLDSEQDAYWLRYYLGTRTWFWRIRVTLEEGPTLEVVVARLIGDEVAFQVIERRWIEGE